jgi:hypothetical protein
MKQEAGTAISGVIGQIKPIDSSAPPANWAFCDGSLLSIDEFPGLFAVLAARFGGDGVNTFALPNLNVECRFAICTDGYFPRVGLSPVEWKLASAETDYIEWQVQALRQGYQQGVPPLGQHTHVDDLDPRWLDRQVQVLKDAYAQGYNPLHRHTPVDELDPVWLERQVQVLFDAYGQGQDSLHRHTPSSHLDPDWLAWQSQVLIDAYGRHSHPLEPHTHMDDLDPAWLEQQVQVFFDALAQGHDPLFRHPHVSELDPGWLAAQAKAMKGTIVNNKESALDDLRRIEGIGPKTAAVLNKSGIQTFSQLANMELDQLRDLLRAARLHLVQPDTWPQQAALAAAGKWRELAALQDTLIGGRRA